MESFFFKSLPPPPQWGPVSRGGGGNVIHDFWNLGKGDEGDNILKCYTFDLFTLSINIH